MDGRVDKVIRVVATSPDSWEGAAQSAIAEASRTLTNLQSGTVIQADIVWGDDRVAQYRLKLEMSFQLDRSRLSADGTEKVYVRRHLVVANQTLASPALHEIIAEKDSTGPSEFHILVPEGPKPTYIADPLGGGDIALPDVAKQRLLALREAEERLDSFRSDFAHLGPRLTGEVGLGDALTSVRRVMERSSFDEVIVSTLPPGVSRWLKLDLPKRIERAFNLPVTALVQRPADT
ncbi:MAG: dodecin family protein [Acidimicrobiales bacterium]